VSARSWTCGDEVKNMATRLRGLASQLELGMTEPATVKTIRDLNGAATHLDDLDALLNLIECMDKELRDGQDAGPRIEELVRTCADIRHRKAKGSDPEPEVPDG